MLRSAQASSFDNDLAHEKWCNDLSATLLCVLVLDRFGDFVSDQVVAPVREMTSQTLASLLIHMPRRSVGHVHRILLQMVEQKNFVIPVQSVDQPQHQPTRGRPRKAATQEEKQRQHVWEVRHAGLLGVKYEVAVRDDLFTGTIVKSEDGEFDDSAKGILRDVVSAALLG